MSGFGENFIADQTDWKMDMSEFKAPNPLGVQRHSDDMWRHDLLVNIVFFNRLGA